MRALILFSTMAVAAVAAVSEAVSLDPLLTQPQLWSLQQADFAKLETAKFFSWTSQAHDSARAGERQLQLFGLPLVESVARFDSGKLNDITATIYDRGDAGDLTKDQFDGLVRICVEALDKYTNVKFTVRGKDPKSAVHAEGLVWQTPAARFLLEYSAAHEMIGGRMAYRPEFVRLEITPPEHTVSLLESAADPVRAKFTGIAHVKRDFVSGDVVIPDVPMVDQGQKGYCAVACTERVMRYYGIRVDENEIAEVANTDSREGTSADAMFDAVKKLGARLRVRVRAIEQMDVAQIVALMREYNQVAKKDHEAAIPDQGRMLDVSAIYHAMKPEVLKEARLKNKSNLGRFQREVQSHVEQGTPLLWSVMLGVVEEKGLSQASGGHMRLIIGYNAKSEEILYTDSWGAGHERKRMPATDAWTITTGLTSIEPL